MFINGTLVNNDAVLCIQWKNDSCVCHYGEQREEEYRMKLALCKMNICVCVSSQCTIHMDGYLGDGGVKVGEGWVIGGDLLLYYSFLNCAVALIINFPQPQSCIKLFKPPHKETRTLNPSPFLEALSFICCLKQFFFLLLFR